MRGSESEEEKDACQLQQANNNALVLQDELIRSEDVEILLQIQLYTMTNDLIQLQKWLEHRSDLQKDFEDFRREQEMKQRDSMFIWFQ